jgi:sialate O-acetylesterase
MNRSVIILLLILVFFNFKESGGQISMPAIFSDHMVLQREMNLPVWGTAKAGSKINWNDENCSRNRIKQTKFI